MEKQFAKLQRIDHNEPITIDHHYEFIYHLQGSLLLALRERRRLTAMQYRHAEEKLKQQRWDRAKKLMEKREGR